MRHIKTGMLLCAILALIPMLLRAQATNKIDLSAIVKTSNGVPIRGAQIKSVQDNVTAVSDSLGFFSISVTPSATLSVSAQGYEAQNSVASPELSEIILTVDPRADQVNIAFRSVDQQNLLGGISYVNMPEILDKNYITYPLADMAAFVPGFHGNLWGNNEMLVLVDGVPRDVGSVTPIEIEQITFLKGVSAVALYGSRAAKGVIMITTKRGGQGDLSINVRANAGTLVPSRFPQYLGSAEYMTLYNEARVNDGLNPLFSDEEIYHHGAGTNPYRYPNVDYYSDEYLQKTFNRYDATVELAGGNERTQFYTNLGFMTEGSLLDFGQSAENRNERFNIRGNVDMKINDLISAKVDVATVFYNGRGINTDYWGGAANLRPHRFTPLIPISMIEETDAPSLVYVNNSEHLIGGQYLLGGNPQHQTNPIADVYAGGSSTFTSRQFQFNTGIDADLKNVLEGLTFKTLFGLDYNTSYVLTFNNRYAVYNPTWTNYGGSDAISSFTRIGEDASTRSQDVAGATFRQTASMSAQLNYSKRFADSHNFTAILLGNAFQQAISGQYHRVANANLGLHLGYDFEDKYFIDFNGALVHSTRLPAHNRQAFNPTLSLGWRLSKEDFFSSSSVIDNLKLGVSAGIIHTDLDITDYFLYQQVYTAVDGAWFSWRDGNLVRSTDARRFDNPDMRFPKREEVNAGLEASLFNGFVNLNGSVFLSRMNGLIVQNNVHYPDYFATGWPNSNFNPYVNYNNDLRSGYDFQVNLNQRVGEVNWSLGLTGTYYNTKAAKRAEILEDEYQRRQGRPVDAIWGLESLGFFSDQEDVDTSPTQRQLGITRPGDLKYKDQNGDGLINFQDEIYLGRAGWSGSPYTFGVNLTANWKNFTFFALGIARTGAYGMKNNNYFMVNAEDKYSEVVRGRWTEETKDVATFPALTTLGGENSYRNSDFWLYSTDRFDLARVQISYDFPQEMLGRTFVKGLGVYVNGANLLTISPNREILELNIGGAPQTRLFNLGVKAQF